MTGTQAGSRIGTFQPSFLRGKLTRCETSSGCNLFKFHGFHLGKFFHETTQPLWIHPRVVNHSEWTPLKNGATGRFRSGFLLGQTVTFHGRFLLNFGRVYFRMRKPIPVTVAFFGLSPQRPQSEHRWRKGTCTIIPSNRSKWRIHPRKLRWRAPKFWFGKGDSF